MMSPWQIPFPLSVPFHKQLRCFIELWIGKYYRNFVRNCNGILRYKTVLCDHLNPGFRCFCKNICKFFVSPSVWCKITYSFHLDHKEYISLVPILHRFFQLF